MRSVASPDGKLLAIQQKNGSIRIVDLVRKQTLRTLSGPGESVGCMALASGEGPLLVGAGRNLYLLDVNGKEGPRRIFSTGASIYRVSVMPALSLAAIATPEGFKVLNINSGDQVFSNLDTPCLDVVFSPDGQTLAAAQGKNITVYDLPNVIERWKGAASFFPRVLSYSQDGALLAVAGDSNTVMVFSNKEGLVKSRTSLGFSASKILHLSITPDGKGFVAGSDRRVYVLDEMSRPESKREIKLDDRITSMVLSRSAQSLLVSCEGTRYLHAWPTNLKLPEGLFTEFKPKVQIRIVQPQVAILSPSTESLVKGESIQLLARVKADKEQKISLMRVLVDGRAVDAQGAALPSSTPLPAGVEPLTEGEELHQFTVPVPNQDCTVALIGETQYATSRMAAVKLRRESTHMQPVRPKPQIRIVPPQVAIVSPSSETMVQGEAVQLLVRVTSIAEQKYQAVKILVDGRPVEVLGGIRPKALAVGMGVQDLKEDEEILLFSVPVPQRDCTVAVFAESQYANSDPVSVRLRREPPPPLKPPPPRVINIVRPEVAILSPRAEELAQFDVVNMLVRIVQSPEQKVNQLRIQVDGQTVASLGETTTKSAPLAPQSPAQAAVPNQTPQAPALVEEIRQISVPIPARHCTITAWAETAYANSEIASLRVRREDKPLPPPPVQIRPEPPPIIPPVVAIVGGASELIAKEENINFSVKISYSQLQKVTGLRVLVDGVAVPTANLRAARPRSDSETMTSAPLQAKAAPGPLPAAADKPTAAVLPGSMMEEIQNFTIPIPPKDCTVAVIAETQLANSELAAFKVRYQVKKKVDPTALPRLYLLAVGVADYQDATLKLTYPAKDAGDFTKVLEKQKGHLFRDVSTNVLTDGKATRDNIMDGLEWLQKQVTQRDVAIVFFAGHGMNDPKTGQFYFLPYNADLNAIKRTMVANTDITSTLDSIPGKRVLFMDSCNSANVSGKTRTRSAIDIAQIRREFEAAGQGAVVFAAASGRQGAQENEDWGNGAFTKAVLEGLNGLADPKKSGRVTVSMLNAYITDRVKEITSGFQTPIFKSQDDLADFPLVILQNPE